MAAVRGSLRSADGRWRIDALVDGTARVYFLGALMAKDVYGAAAVEKKLAELGAPPIGDFDER